MTQGHGGEKVPQKEGQKDKAKIRQQQRHSREKLKQEDAARLKQAHKPPKPNALEKALRRQQQHREKQVKHEKEKHGQYAAPNKLEKARWGNALSSDEKQREHEQRHEQHQNERTPNKLEKALREHTSQGSGQQQAHDKSLHAEKQGETRAPGTPEKSLSEKHQQLQRKSQHWEGRHGELRYKPALLDELLTHKHADAHVLDKWLRANRDEPKKPELLDGKWHDTAEQKAFEQRVLDAHMAENIQEKKPLYPDLNETELGVVSGTEVKMQKDAAEAAGLLLKAANQDLDAAKRAGNPNALKTVRVTAISGYRGSAHQEGLYRQYFEQKYYNETAARRATLPGGEHGDAAVNYMVKYIKGRIAAPGFSNHQAGLAIDFLQKRTDGHTINNSTNIKAIAEWRNTWFHNWLTEKGNANAKRFGFQEYQKEPWHWIYHMQQQSQLHEERQNPTTLNTFSKPVPPETQQQARDKLLPAEKQGDTRTPGTPEKGSGEKQQQSGEKSQPQERPHGLIYHHALDEHLTHTNTLDKWVRAKRDESKKDDLTRSYHDQTPSSREREERRRIATPADGIGFQFGSAQLVPGMMEQWLASQPDSLRTALNDPQASVIVTASASRSGPDSYNLRLSQERADVVEQWLKDHGAQAQIETRALGEEPAKKAGKPENVDDASDRVAKIEIKAANSLEHPDQGYTKDSLGRNADLVSFRPPLEVQAYVETNFLLGAMLPIEKGHGPINQDYYAVTVDHLPQINGQIATPEQLHNYIRTHMYDFTAHQFGTLHAYNKTEQNKWDSPNPLGAVLQWDMAPVFWTFPPTFGTGREDGSVVVSAWAPDHWIFSTIRTLADWEHPVSGNREFGFKQQEDGKYVFYTRGADRPTGWSDNHLWQETIFQGAHNLWMSYLKGIVDFVNSHGGTASITSKIHQLNDWDTVRALYHHPTAKWLTEPNR